MELRKGASFITLASVLRNDKNSRKIILSTIYHNIAGKRTVDEPNNSSCNSAWKVPSSQQSSSIPSRFFGLFVSVSNCSEILIFFFLFCVGSFRSPFILSFLMYRGGEINNFPTTIVLFIQGKSKFTLIMRTSLSSI